VSALAIIIAATFCTVTLSFAIAEFFGMADDEEDQPTQTHGGYIDREN
jgi:hypothetical protein